MTETTESSYRERLNRVLAFIEGNLSRTLPLEELAGVAHFSPHHFHRIFTGMTGESVKSYIRRLRLQKAAWELVYSRRSVTDVALDAGYETHESFTRAFKAAFGAAPSRFRKDNAHRRPAFHELDPRPHVDLKETLNQQGACIMKAAIKTIPGMKIAYVRHLGPYDQCGPAWEKLCAWAGPKGLMNPDAVFLGVCHDDPDVTPPEKIRYDASIVVQGEVAPEGEVGVTELPGGDYAVALHKGPFSNLHKTYAAMCGQWVPGQGREVTSGPSYEIYKNDPGKTPPEELLIEIFLPLKPAN